MKEQHRWYRWILWGVLLVPYMVVYFHRLAIGVLQEDLTREFSLSATAFAGIGAVYFYTYAALQIPAGLLADSLGPRRTISVSALLIALGTVIFATAPVTAVLFLGRLVVGIGVSAVFVGILKVLALWFKEGEFATMTGLTGLVGTLGGVLAQAPLYRISRAVGWRLPFLVVAAFAALAGILCYVLVRDRPPPGVRDVPAAAPGGGVGPALVATLKNWRTWPPWIVFAGVYGAFVTLTGTFGQAYLVSTVGISAARASRLLTGAVAAIAMGGFLFALLSDRLQRRRVPMAVMTLLGLGAWILLVSGRAGSGDLLTAVMIVIGLSAGVVLTTLPCGKEVNDPNYSGSSTAVVNVGGFLGAAVIPLLMGRILDRGGDYSVAVLVCIAAMATAFVATLFITETRCRNIHAELVH